MVSFASYAYLGFYVGACFGFDSLWTIGFNFVGKGREVQSLSREVPAHTPAHILARTLAHALLSMYTLGRPGTSPGAYPGAYPRCMPVRCIHILPVYAHEHICAKIYMRVFDFFGFSYRKYVDYATQKGLAHTLAHTLTKPTRHLSDARALIGAKPSVHTIPRRIPYYLCKLIQTQMGTI